MERTSVLRCPKCGGTHITKRGSGDKTGIPRFFCGTQKGTGPVKNGCGWHGYDVVGREDAAGAGVPRKEADALHRKVTKSGGTRRYVITAAQNATPIWMPFYNSLLRYCEHNDAELLVIPYRYKNPTSMWTAEAKHDDWWAHKLAKYLIDKRVNLHPHLTLLADIKTQPTASSPLVGFETLTGPNSAIVGHPKMELMVVPTPQSRMPKILTTTGAVTKKNYIPAKAGKKAEHHHTFGACVVELDEGKFHIRQLNATRSGDFCDLDWEYYPDRKPERVRIAGIVLGDSHVDFADPNVVTATFGTGGMTEVLDPAKIVWHDVLDFYSGSHHHRHEVFTRYAKHHSKRNNVEAEIDRCFKFIDKWSCAAQNIFVNSNHHNHLAQWVKETDPRQDPENAVFWAQTFTAMCKGTTMTDKGAQTPDPFVYWARHKLKCAQKSVFLNPDDSYEINGIEVGYHGDRGANGARGSIKAFGKIGAKTVIGHSHTPGIKDGVFQTGTSSLLRLEYTHGPSSWLHTHCLIYGNGKRTLVNIIDGKWRARPRRRTA